MTRGGSGVADKVIQGGNGEGIGVAEGLENGFRSFRESGHVSIDSAPPLRLFRCYYFSRAECFPCDAAWRWCGRVSGLSSPGVMGMAFGTWCWLLWRWRRREEGEIQ